MNLCPNSEQYERVCKNEFDRINFKLDRLDAAIRGDPGDDRPGVAGRLILLESVARRREKIFLLLLAAMFGLVLSRAYELFVGFRT